MVYHRPFYELPESAAETPQRFFCFYNSVSNPYNYTKTPAPYGDRGFGHPEAAGSPVSHNSQGGGRCEYTLVEYGFAKIRNCF